MNQKTWACSSWEACNHVQYRCGSKDVYVKAPHRHSHLRGADGCCIAVAGEFS
jgi:hypothetical protein